MTDPLAALSEAGVSIWLDDLSRERLRSGNLEQLVRDKHIVGVTTNPSIFQKAMSEGDAYDEQLRELALRGTDVGEAVRSRSRDRSSSQMETPAADSSASGSVMRTPQLPVVLPDVLPSLDSEACAAATTRSPVRPNWSYRTEYGAEAPKCSSATHSP